MKKLLALFIVCLIAHNLYAQPIHRGNMAIENEDGTNTTYPYKVYFPNSTVTDNGDGTASVFKNGNGTFSSLMVTGSGNTTIGENLIVAEDVFATKYHGDGSLLENLPGGNVSVSDEAYGETWDNDTTGGASRHSLYQKIESLAGGHDAVTVVNTSTVDLSLNGQELSATVNASAGYLTTETDPVWSGDKANYTPGNWSAQGYLTAETDPVWSGDQANYTPTANLNITNWDTAYGWGNHSAAGYLTVETDPVWTAAAGDYYNKTEADAEFINATELDAVDNLDNYYNKTETAALDSDILTNFYNTTQVLAIDGLSNYYNQTEIAGLGYLTEGDIDASSELANIMDDETGSGALVFGTSPTIATPTLTLQDGNGAAPTTDGQIKYDRTLESLQVGDGTATSQFDRKMSKGLVVYNLTSSDDFPFWKAPRATTIRNIHGVCIAGAANFTLNECDANGANCAVVDSSWIAANATNADDDGTLSNPSIDANDWVGLNINNCTENTTTLSVSFEYTYN